MTICAVDFFLTRTISAFTQQSAPGSFHHPVYPRLLKRDHSLRGGWGYIFNLPMLRVPSPCLSVNETMGGCMEIMDSSLSRGGGGFYRMLIIGAATAAVVPGRP